jgi:hypothetical protein
MTDRRADRLAFDAAYERWRLRTVLGTFVIPWLLAVLFRSFFDRLALFGGMLVLGQLALMVWLPDKFAWWLAGRLHPEGKP